jgi:Uma2 family endonuclease
MGAAENLKTISAEAYLEQEQEAEGKTEFHLGQVIALAGSTVSHERIACNVVAALHFLLKGSDCQEFSSEIKVAIGHDKAFYYPDAMVVCGPLSQARNRKDMIDNPRLIVEILSAESEARDRGEKFLSYQMLPSLQEYVLISQDQCRVEVFFKGPGQGWLYQQYTDLGAAIPLQSLNVSLSALEIYDRVALG